MAFATPDTAESSAIQLRRGVAVIRKTAPDRAHATITINAAKVRELSTDFSAANAILAAASRVTDEDIAREFFGYFDPLATKPAQPSCAKPKPHGPCLRLAAGNAKPGPLSHPLRAGVGCCP